MFVLARSCPSQAVSVGVEGKHYQYALHVARWLAERHHEQQVLLKLGVKLSCPTRSDLLNSARMHCSLKVLTSFPSCPHLVICAFVRIYV